MGAIIKTDQAGGNSEITDALGEDVLQKSWNDSIAVLRKALEETGKPLEKAKKKAVAKDEDDTEDDEEDDDIDDDDTFEEPSKKKKGNMKKSLPDYISEDPEAEIAMDVEPYLKSLAVGIDKSIEQKMGTLGKSVQALAQIVQAQGTAFLHFAELQKSIDDKVQKIGETPLPLSSVLSKSAGRFSNETAPTISNNKDVIMRQAVDLCKSSKISSVDVTILEDRLNRGVDIPDRLKPFFINKEGK